MTTESKVRVQIKGVLDAAMRPIDSASAVFFRIMFGFLMAVWGWHYLLYGRVTSLYVEPSFHFTYYGFDWIAPWPGNGMYFHFLALIALAICVAIGLWYRVASLLFAIGFTYFFLLDRTNYFNHYYLIGLFCWWMPWLPLNRNVSLDAARNPKIASQSIPAWVLWILLFHTGIPYVFGGIAKLSADWLAGQPMGMMLASRADIPVLGGWLAWPPMGSVFSIGGLVFDLLVVPALLWKKTRCLAYIFCFAFQ